jgi:hypothetical protein
MGAVVDHTGPRRASYLRRGLLERALTQRVALPGPPQRGLPVPREAIDIDRVDGTTGFPAGSR